MCRKKYQVLSMYYHFVLRPELFKVLELLGSSCKKQILETHFRYTEEFSQRLETKNMDFFFFKQIHVWEPLLNCIRFPEEDVSTSDGPNEETLMKILLAEEQAGKGIGTGHGGTQSNSSRKLGRP